MEKKQCAPALWDDAQRKRDRQVGLLRGWKGHVWKRLT
jgi:hypothetical protein